MKDVTTVKDRFRKVETMSQENRIAIKAGSSIFQNEDAFESVADLLVPLAQEAQIVFVVSALRGVTDRTIDEIAGDQRNVLDQALRGNMTDAAEQWNTPQIAARLVEPENYCVRQLTAELQRRGQSVRGLQHGSEYPLVGVDNGNYLFATPDVDASRQLLHQPYSERIIVVPGFGVRNTRGQTMCTGRGSSDLTLTQFAELLGIQMAIYWKDTAGFWENSQYSEQGIVSYMTRGEAIARSREKVLDRRVYDFKGPIIITSAGLVNKGTYIDRPMNFSDWSINDWVNHGFEPLP